MILRSFEERDNFNLCHLQTLNLIELNRDFEVQVNDNCSMHIIYITVIFSFKSSLWIRFVVLVKRGGDGGGTIYPVMFIRKDCFKMRFSCQMTGAVFP